MCTPISSLMDKKELTNWAELPPDLTAAILSRLGAFDILENAQKVCKSWHRVCKEPWMWRKIDMYNPKLFSDTYLYKYEDLMTMCRHAVDRSQGCLVEIDIWYYCTAELLNYIADRSCNLRILRFMMCDRMTDNIFIEALVKLPLLEYVEVSYCSLSVKCLKCLKVVGKSCPNLKTLKLISNSIFMDDEYNNDDALAIAESMPQLLHLEIFGNLLTNVGLNAIFDGCSHLKNLDLHNIFNLYFTGDLEKRCTERFKVWKRPFVSTIGHPYLDDYVFSDDDYEW